MVAFPRVVRARWFFAVTVNRPTVRSSYRLDRAAQDTSGRHVARMGKDYRTNGPLRRVFTRVVELGTLLLLLLFRRSLPFQMLERLGETELALPCARWRIGSARRLSGCAWLLHDRRGLA